MIFLPEGERVLIKIKMKIKPENIKLLPVSITGKDGEYFCHYLREEKQSPLIQVSVNKTPLPPHNYIAINQVYSEGSHIIIASVNNLQEADSVAYNLLLESLIFSIGNQIIDVGCHKAGACWFLASDQTIHKNPNTLEKIISSLKERKKANENMFFSNPIELYEQLVEETQKGKKSSDGC